MKKILIALVSVALLAGCSADGVFSGGTLENPNVVWSNDDDDNPPDDNLVYCSLGGYCERVPQSICSQAGGTIVSSCSSGPGNNNLVYCSIAGSCQQIYQSMCTQAGGTVVSSCPSNPITGQYCYYDGDCDLIGGYYTQSVSQCTSARNGTVMSLQECNEMGATIYDDL